MSLSSQNQSNRPNFLSASANAKARFRRSTQRPPYGIPPYIWISGGVVTAGAVYTYYAFLDSVPMTNRQRWIATSPEWERQMGDQEYQNLLKRYQKQVLPPSHPASKTVHRVGSRIAAASQEFAKQYHVPKYDATKRPYTYTVVRSDDTANAFVLPGNHVFVMTGLFQYVKDEDELAGVLGHETAHNLARHAGEKISGSIVVSMLARLTLLVDPTGALLTVLLPAATLFRELPHSRTQETEADRIGVHLAGMACYDPRASKRVFAAMQKGEQQGQQPPEFLSTHPSHASRVGNFDKWLPDAMRRYESDMMGGGRCQLIRQQMEQARIRAAQEARRGGAAR